ncbi:amyloid beta A4 precursor protein-binding family B member 2-like [Sinocyclocheilus rhinocerous]|uniref:amyloid beta A4 precursor protein-binding family B member 2-like n=1 Tax=Sinocyclocheilus rhinocerous TaxID=307959 RepID=UPI0007B9FF4A|nr:PREDICTED: amyloid beta A4 precursor protein-binding family B member 2-like [Sinocyclocheilus rhinocerous]
MMSVQKPPLRRSASTIESTNHGGPLLTPPTSLNLRSSHNQQLSCDTIKEGVVTVSKETQDSKSRQKYALTNIQNAMGLSQNPAPLYQSHASFDRRPAPTKSASSSSLYCSSLSFSASNPKLAKNGTNLQLKEEQLDLNKNDRNLKYTRKQQLL